MILLVGPPSRQPSRRWLQQQWRTFQLCSLTQRMILFPPFIVPVAAAAAKTMDHGCNNKGERCILPPPSSRSCGDGGNRSSANRLLALQQTILLPSHKRRLRRCHPSHSHHHARTPPYYLSSQSSNPDRSNSPLRARLQSLIVLSSFLAGWLLGQREGALIIGDSYDTSMAQIPPLRLSTATSMSSPPPLPSPPLPLFPHSKGTPPPLPNRSRFIPLAAATLPLWCHPTTALLGERYIGGNLLEYLALSLDGDSAVAAIAKGDGGVNAPPPHDNDNCKEERESPEDDASKRQPPRGSGLPSKLSGGGNLDERPRLHPAFRWGRTRRRRRQS
jgi:hypothetical protein